MIRGWKVGWCQKWKLRGGSQAMVALHVLVRAGPTKGIATTRPRTVGGRHALIDWRRGGRARALIVRSGGRRPLVGVNGEAPSQFSAVKHAAEVVESGFIAKVPLENDLGVNDIARGRVVLNAEEGTPQTVEAEIWPKVLTDDRGGNA